jgi:hypothetical protein
VRVSKVCTAWFPSPGIAAVGVDCEVKCGMVLWSDSGIVFATVCALGSTAWGVAAGGAVTVEISGVGSIDAA